MRDDTTDGRVLMRTWTENGVKRERLYFVAAGRALQLQSARWHDLADITRQAGQWSLPDSSTVRQHQVAL